jgi:hypothetical protein
MIGFFFFAADPAAFLAAGRFAFFTVPSSL